MLCETIWHNYKFLFLGDGLKCIKFVLQQLTNKIMTCSEVFEYFIYIWNTLLAILIIYLHV